mmetsp:Transcript_166/g.474  ORF Transcript_166/g.474 Transcript_166/m.474 type:complete len:134 (+) Transcript_166:36-437(+)
MEPSRAVVEEGTEFAALGGVFFVKEHFYKFYDTMRHEVHHLYKGNSTLNWNGNVYQGETAIQKFLMHLPASKHSVLVVDSHPISDTQNNMLVSVEGVVSYGGGGKRLFHETFILAKEHEQRFYVAYDTFRFLD